MADMSEKVHFLSTQVEAFKSALCLSCESLANLKSVLRRTNKFLCVSLFLGFVAIALIAATPFLAFYNSILLGIFLVIDVILLIASQIILYNLRTALSDSSKIAARDGQRLKEINS